MLALLVVTGCSAPQVTDGGSGGGAGGGNAFTGFDCRTDGPCTEAQVGSTSVGTCSSAGLCQCQPGYGRNPVTETCWPVDGFCRGPDAGLFTAGGVDVAPTGLCGDDACPTGSTCSFDAGSWCQPAAANKCVGPLGCGLLECTNGCTCADRNTGRCSCDGPKACDVGQDQTCNDDVSMSSFSGHCVAAPGSPNRCICNPGYSRNPATGKCRITP